VFVLNATSSPLRDRWKRRPKPASRFPDRCDICGTSQWQGRPLALILRHLNGDSGDNRVENLTLLCPNCHSQAGDWGPNSVRGARLRLIKGGRDDSAPFSGDAA
jgi:5-methylcytosine-specific restriction endonuclease McrA